MIKNKTVPAEKKGGGRGNGADFAKEKNKKEEIYEIKFRLITFV